MAPLERWNDGRLDDRFKRIDEQIKGMTPHVEQVGVLAEKMSSLGRSIDQLREDLAKAGERGSALKIGVISAVSAAAVGSLVTIAAGVHP